MGSVGPRAVAIALALLLGGGFTPGVALAASLGTASKGMPVTSARYSAVLSAAPAQVGTSGAVSTSIASDSFWWLTNNGTVPLSAAASFTLTITLTASSGSTVQAQTCSTGWNEAGNSCSGTITTIATSPTAANYPLSTPMPVNGAVRIRLHNSSLIKVGGTATMSVTVTRA